MSINSIKAHLSITEIQLNLYQALSKTVLSLNEKCQRAQSRKVLLRLDQLQLEDIGISVEQAHIEGNKSFWEE